MHDKPTEIKMTQQRRMILDELHACMDHPTADELFMLVRKKLPKISLATVYRNLDALSDAGLIRKLELAGGQMRFDRTLDDHFHVTCSECGKIEDIHETKVGQLKRKFQAMTDFELIHCDLDFKGICPDCRGKKKK